MSTVAENPPQPQAIPQLRRQLTKTTSGKVYQVRQESIKGERTMSRQGTLQHSVEAKMQRDLLSELQTKSNFSLAEIESMYNNFKAQTAGSTEIDEATFTEILGHAFGIKDDDLLHYIFTAMDDSRKGSINFAQFVTAVSTIFRGDQVDILSFWFRMYDDDDDGFLSLQNLKDMLRDVAQAQRKPLQVFIEEHYDSDERPTNASLLDFDEFCQVMHQMDVIPAFHQPHKHGQDQQLNALRCLNHQEREVMALMGVQVQKAKGQQLISEGSRSPNFYYILEGKVQLVRQGVVVSEQGEGSYLGEAALFDDLKELAEDGTVMFTTSATIISDNAVFINMNIRDFLPLVYHGQQGATSIVQNLGKSLMSRLEETEHILEQVLQQTPEGTVSQLRLSTKDWQNWRKKLLRQWSLRYHKIGRRGKLEVVSTKNIGTAQDLSVAYSPGVAEPCLSIQRNEKYAYDYTAKGHLVGVVTNGTAVLGLGNIGPTAAKPVMEGKAVLFKKFADIDAFDIELDAKDPEFLVNTVKALQPTFGGINLEDIKAPECFYVEKECQKRMNIPVFHDDQHGTAIVAGAGLLNALQLVHKKIEEIKVCICGVGAAGFTCAKYFVSLGVQKENLLCVDVQGVVHADRDDISPDNYLSEVAVSTEKRTLQEAVNGADVFLGLSAGGLLKPEMLLSMNRDPLVFACANPYPEIDPAVALSTRDDVIMATGRSDYPNQINNVCAFPFIFRGALDARAQQVNETMKQAATNAIAKLAREKPKRSKSYAKMEVEEGKVLADETPDLSREYIIPKPFDERLFIEVSAAVYGAAISSGVAPNADLSESQYRDKLRDQQLAFQSK